MLEMPKNLKAKFKNLTQTNFSVKHSNSSFNPKYFDEKLMYWSRCVINGKAGRLASNIHPQPNESTDISLPGCLGIIVTCIMYCCIFAATKDKFGSLLKKLFHSSTLHIYHHNSSSFLKRHKNVHVFKSC